MAPREHKDQERHRRAGWVGAWNTDDFRRGLLHSGPSPSMRNIFKPVCGFNSSFRLQNVRLVSFQRTLAPTMHSDSRKTHVCARVCVCAREFVQGFTSFGECTFQQSAAHTLTSETTACAGHSQNRC